MELMSMADEIAIKMTEDEWAVLLMPPPYPGNTARRVAAHKVIEFVTQKARRLFRDGISKAREPR